MIHITPQYGSAVVETDHELTPKQSVGIRAIILPVGVSLSHVAQCGPDEDEE